MSERTNSQMTLNLQYMQVMVVVNLLPVVSANY